MKQTLKTLALATTAAFVTATASVADPVCRTPNLAGNWILTLNGSFPDVEQNPVWVDHLFIPCDVTIARDGRFSGTCQDMLAASVGEPATDSVSGQIRANRRCVVSGSGNLGGNNATFEGRVVDTGTRQASLIEGTMIVPLAQAPLPGINYVIMNTRLIRDPWGGSAFNLNGD